MLSVAVTGVGGSVIERAYPGLAQAGTTLVPTLVALCSEAGWRVRDLELAAVSLGPGSFTGLRVGAATANALALALNIPVVGVPSLEVIAQGAPGGWRCALCLSPHRRGSFYGRVFTRVGDSPVEAASGILAGGLDEVLRAVAAEAPEVGLIAGPDDAQAQWEGMQASDRAGREFVTVYPSARVVLSLALSHPPAQPPRLVVPIYVKASQPEEREKASGAGDLR